jgi:hypothetical protein
MKPYARRFCRRFFVILVLLLFTPGLTVCVYSSTEPRKSLHDAALRLVQYCNDPKIGFDERDIATLVGHVMSAKKERASVLPESGGCPGAYQEFDMNIAFPRFMAYSFSALIPAVITRPSSLRYSFWRGPQGGAQNLPDHWGPLLQTEKPLIIHGLQQDSNTPDLTTGVYYTYDLKRTLVLTRHQGRPVLVSISKQIDKSRVGEKGFILGNDSDWNYYYSGEPGSAKSGLGWVKSYIYDYFSVTVYAESGARPATLRTGVFQWIKAGWSGINFVQPSHIIKGMERFARNNRLVLESPYLPAPDRIIAAYQELLKMPADELANTYQMLQQAQRTSALQNGKISRAKARAPSSSNSTSKEQMVEELMLEVLKEALGRPTPLGRSLTKHLSSL